MRAFHETKRHCTTCGAPLPYKRARKTLLCQKCNGKNVGQRGRGSVASLKWMWRVAKTTEDPGLAVNLIYQISRQR